MYFWKCWYSTRWVVVVYLVPIVLLLAGILTHAPLHISDPLTAHGIWRISASFIPFSAIAAWILGSIGLGRDIAEGNGPYLLTQPRTIRYFIWSDFAVAMSELAVLIALPIALLIVLIQTHVIVFEHLYIAGMNADPVTASTAALVLIAAVLFAGIIYSLSYLFTAILRKTGFSIFLSAAFFLVYKAVGAIAPSFPAPYTFHLPPWWINPYDAPYSTTLTPGMLLAIGSRIAAILLFIFAAQLVTEKVETRA
jgi:hypothetical protein